MNQTNAFSLSKTKLNLFSLCEHKPSKGRLTYFDFECTQVKTKRKSTQFKATLKQLALELDIIVTCSTNIIFGGSTTNFSATFTQARELKIGTDTH